MKKWFIVSLLCLIGSSASAKTDGDISRLEMQITDLMTPAGIEQMRSVTWYAEGWIDYGMNCIEIETNEGIGTASVVVTNMYGQAVASATIDPAVSTYVMLPLPAAGEYRLTVTGTEYLGECNFTVE